MMALHINGRRYTGWEKITLRRGILQAAGHMQLIATAPQTAIQPGAGFTLVDDETTLLTGYVDQVAQSLSSAAHKTVVIGRDKAADLVDCSVQVNGKTGQLNGLKLAALLQQLCTPYNVQVIINPDLDADDPFDTWSLNPGDTVWSSIEKACRQRGVLALSNGRGDLVITRAGTAHHPVALVEGKNVLQAKLVRDQQKRFHTYQALAQQSAPSDWSQDDQPDNDKTDPSATITDAGCRKPRYLAIVDDNSASSQVLTKKLQWECNVRRAKSESLNVKVADWSAQSVHWQPNQQVSVSLPTLGVAGRWLIVSIEQTVDKTGFITQLTLARPEAFTLQPAPANNDAANSSVFG